MLNRDFNAYLMSNGYVLLLSKSEEYWSIVRLVALAKKRQTIYFPFCYRGKEVYYEGDYVS